MAIRVPFKMRNTNTGDYDAGLNLSAAGVIKVSKWGAEFANALGGYTDVGGGTYYYTPDATEETAPWILVRVVLSGYDVVEQREDVGTTVAEAVTALEAYIDAAVTTIDGHTDTATAAVTTAVNAHTDSATSALATSTDVSVIEAAIGAIPTNPLLTDDARLDHLDVDVSSRLAPTTPGRTLNVSAGGAADADVQSIIDDAISAGSLSAAAATKIIDALYAYVEESGTAFPNAETFAQRRRIEFSILALKAPADLFSSPYEFRDGADSKDRAAYDMVDGVRTPTALDGT